MSHDNPFPEYPANPYASEDPSLRTPTDIELPDGQQRGKVSQISTVGILMIVQGALWILCGIGGVVMAFVFPRILQEQMMNNPALQNNPNQLPPEQLGQIMMAVYGVGGGALLLLGLLTLFSGFRIHRHRGRVLGIVTLSLGLGTILTCYCFPTALALFIYGLIVLLDRSVKKAFELGETGYSPLEIQTAFARLPLR
ncbi:MAG: hypothetical protein R3C19_00480 [Planctomycetaceae bacterium]